MRILSSFEEFWSNFKLKLLLFIHGYLHKNHSNGYCAKKDVVYLLCDLQDKYRDCLKFRTDLKETRELVERLKL